MSKKDRVLVIGGTGFIGNHFVSLLNQNHFDFLSAQRNLKNLDKRYLVADLFEVESILQIIEKFKPSIVVNLAWETSKKNYKQSTINWEYKNAEIKLFNALNSKLIKNYISLGSCTELGIHSPNANSDKNIPNPEDEYSQAKLETYKSIVEIKSKTGIKFTWIRPFQVYGKRQNNSKIIPKIINSFQYGKPLIINDAGAILDWITNIDVSRAILYLLKYQLDGIFDVGTGIGHSIADVVEIIREKIPNQQKSKIVFKKVKSNRQVNLVLDKSQSRIFKLGWRPNYTLDKYIKEIINDKKN